MSPAPTAAKPKPMSAIATPAPGTPASAPIPVRLAITARMSSTTPGTREADLPALSVFLSVSF